MNYTYKYRTLSSIRTFKRMGTRISFSKTKGDKVIWALVVLLALVSLLAVYSATGSLAYKNYKGNTEVYLFKQVAFIVVGIAGGLFCASS